MSNPNDSGISSRDSSDSVDSQSLKYLPKDEKTTTDILIKKTQKKLIEINELIRIKEEERSKSKTGTSNILTRGLKGLANKTGMRETSESVLNAQINLLINVKEKLEKTLEDHSKFEADFKKKKHELEAKRKRGGRKTKKRRRKTKKGRRKTRNCKP